MQSKFYPRAAAMMLLATFIPFFALAFGAPLPSDELAELQKFQENQMCWINSAVSEGASAKLKGVRVPPFAELGLLKEGTVRKIIKTLYCTIDKHLSSSSECDDYVSLDEGRLIMRIDEEEKAIFLGYTFFVNDPELKPHSLRNLVYERAQRFWALTSQTLNEQHPDYQQFHVGYGTGGSIATLLGSRAALSSRLESPRPEKTNQLNQVKVFTVEEISIFTTDMTLDPIGACNHAAFSSEQSFETPGFHTKATKFVIQRYNAEAMPISVVPFEKLPFFFHNLSRARSLNRSEIQSHQNILLRHTGMIKFLSTSNLLVVFTTSSHKLYGHDQDTCVQKLKEQLNTFLPGDRDATIRCRVKPPSINAPSRNDFEIECVFDLRSNGSSVLLSSYRAKLAHFGEYEDSCASIEVNLLNNSWNNCINQLSEDSSQISLLWPVGKHETSTCHNFPISWEGPGTVCVVKPNASDQQLPRMHAVYPKVFFSLVNLASEFPTECTNLIEPLSLEDGALPQAKELLSTVSQYFEQMNNPLAATLDEMSSNVVKFIPSYKNNHGRHTNHKQLPPLFKNHSTGIFRTKTLELSDSEFLASSQTAEQLIRCTKAANPKIINCTLSANQWVENACPRFCAHRQQEQGVNLCETMVFCSEISAFVGIGTSLRKTVADPFITMERAPIPQYALYRFAFHNVIDLSIMSGLNFLQRFCHLYAGVFFTEIPRITTESRRPLICTSERLLEGWVDTPKEATDEPPAEF